MKIRFRVKPGMTKKAMSEEKKCKCDNKEANKNTNEKLRELAEKAEAYLNNWKRCQADFENYKKDQQKRMEEFRKFARDDLIAQIFPVLDNFESSLEHIPEDQKESAWVTGIIYIRKQLEDVLKSNGVEEIEVKEGDKFNPEVHEAVSDTNNTNKHTNATNKVSKVVRKGYRIDEKVIRAAKVIVE